MAFSGTETAFAQVVDHPDRNMEPGGDDLGGQLGAFQGRGADGADPGPGEEVAGGTGLMETVPVERHVDLALDQADAVPFGLAMAEEIESLAQQFHVDPLLRRIAGPASFQEWETPDPMACKLAPNGGGNGARS